MRIAYVSAPGTGEQTAASNLDRRIIACLLSQGFDVSLIDPLFDAQRAWVSKARAKMRGLLSEGQFLWSRDRSLLQHYGKELGRRLKKASCDLVFSHGTEAIAYLPESLGHPTAFWSEASVGSLLSCSPSYSTLATKAAQEALDSDTRALRQCALGCYTSDWAVDGAVFIHNAPRDKLLTLPFGPSVEAAVDEGEIPELVGRRLEDPWHLLFVADRWIEQRGELALSIVRELNRRGRPALLHIVGCQPPDTSALPTYVRLHGFIDRHDAGARGPLSDLFRQAAFLLLPSQAEVSSGLASDAAAHALPTLPIYTSGITLKMKEGIANSVFATAPSLDSCVDHLLEAAVGNTYAQLCVDSFRDFQHRLNWETSGRALKSRLEQCALSRAPLPQAISYESRFKGPALAPQVN